MKEIIEKAMETGWKMDNIMLNGSIINGNEFSSSGIRHPSDVVLDPLFWKALFPDTKGKQWVVDCEEKHGHPIYDEHVGSYKGFFCGRCGKPWTIEEHEIDISSWQSQAESFFSTNFYENWDGAVKYLQASLNKGY